MRSIRARRSIGSVTAVAIVATTLSLATVYSDPAGAASPDLTIEIVTAPNFVVDSNIETPSSYGPESAHVSATVCNTGTETLTDVFVNAGDFDPDGNGDYTDSTPGIYPERTHDGLTGTFSFTHEGGSQDAVRYITDLAPGECTTQYYYISYPTLDDNGDSVTGGNSPDDDLWLDMDMWVTATHPNDGEIFDTSTETVTMRSEISAMANKTWPNTSSKVPDEYLAAFESQLGWRPDVESSTAGAEVGVEGVWYDLGNVNKGYDADGDFVPDYDLFMQPVGDPDLYDPTCTRLVRTYGVIIVKLNDGTEQIIAFEDQLYFKDIPENNTGAVGLVFYEFVTVDGGCTSTMTPYQEVASGSDNEKFNGDYGAASASFSPSTPELALDKNGSVSVGPGGTATFEITADNQGDTSFGSMTFNMPLVLRDSIPADTVYVPGSAEAGNTFPTGVTANVLYSTDGGSTWTTTEPVASTVTDIAWWLSAALDPGQSVTVAFDVTVATDYAEATLDNNAVASVGSADPFIDASHTVLMEGPYSLSGTVFEDNGGTGGSVADGLLDSGEPGVTSVDVALWVDVDGDGNVGADDLLWSTTTTAGNGDYTFPNLPDGNYLVVLDDGTVPSGYTTTSAETLASTIAGADVVDYDFGIVEPLLIDKSGPTAALEGEEITFDLTVTNQLPITPTNSGPVFETVVVTEDLWSTAVSTGTTVTSPANATLAPDSTFTTATWDSQGYWYHMGPSSDNTGAILQVEWIGAFQLDAPVDNDLVRVGTWSPVTGTVAYTLPTADVNSTVGSTTILSYDVTGDQNWTWAGIEPGGDLEAYLGLARQQGADGATMSLDAIGFRVTYETLVEVPTSGFDPDSTISPLPLTDTYDPTKFEFVSASITPTSVDETTGVITWDDIGPLNSGLTETVQVTFRVLDAYDSTTSTSTHTNTMEIAGATFASGLPANDETDTADTTITGAGSVSGTLWNDADSDGWVGADGYEGGEQLLEGVEMTLFACVDGGGNLIYTGTTTQTCADNGGTWDAVGTTTTDENGYYEFGALEPGYYVVETDPASLPGSVTQSGDPDQVGSLCTSCDDAYGDTTTTLGTIPLEISIAEDISDINFGYSIPPAVYGTLWEDVDGDGVQEEGEGPLVGWTVEVFDSGGTLIGTVVTDADGNYELGDLSNGVVYDIVVTPPAGETWNSTFETDGSTDGSITFTGVAGVIDGSNDFAYQQTGSSTIGDQLFYDWDGDGIQDAIDEAIPGVAMELWRDDDGDGIGDVLVATTTTDAAGNYLFTDLPASDYIVEVDTSSSPLDSTFQTGDPDQPGIACDDCDSAGQVSVDGTSSYDAVDFGYQPVGTGQIGDQVFFDADGDGVFGPGDSAISDITVELWVDLDGDGTYQLLDTTTSTADGTYSFTDLPAGDYQIIVDDSDPDLPVDGYGLPLVTTTPTSVDVTLTDGQTADAADFGFVNLGVIGDTIFADANANGTQDTGETGIAGVTVELWEDTTGDGVGDTLVATTVTAADGTYAFTGLVPGDYAVVVDESTLPYDSVIQTADPDRDGVPCDDNTYPSLPDCDGQTVAYPIEYGTVFLGADLGYLPPGVIGDYVWLDADGDGVQDDGEAPLAYVTINLYDSGGALVATTTTDGDGLYSFSGLADDTYSVVLDEATLPTTMTATTGPESVGSNTASVTVTSGSSTYDIDFGYALSGSSTLSGTICLEPSGGTNGTCDDPANETELEGITVNLYDATGTLIGSTSTDVNGDYTFVGLPDGDYTVSVGTGVFPLNISDVTDPSITETASSAYQSVTVSGATTNVDFPFEQTTLIDLGDLDSPFDTSFGSGPYNEIGTIYLGAAVDADNTTLSSPDALGDDNDGVDDEDGVTFNAATWAPDALDDGDDGTVTVTVTGGDAYLVAWIDWNQDGQLTGPDEMIINTAVTAGTADYSFDIPEGIDLNDTFAARFRVFESPPPLASISYSGAYGVGEIEDYLITFPELSTVKAVTAGPTNNADGTIAITYQITTTNTGTATLYDVDVTDSLGTFGTYTATPTASGEYSVTGVSISSTTPDPLVDPLSASTTFDGETNTSLLDVAAGGSLDLGESVVIEFTVNFIPDYLTGCADTCSFDNTATSTGDQVSDGTSGGDATTTSDPVSTPLGSVSGSVSADTNFDGIGDTDLAGVVIELYADFDGDGNYTDLVASTSTDATGDYTFGNLAPDDYQIVETQPAGYASLDDSDGNNDDLVAVTAVSGTDVTGNDFLESTTADPVLVVDKTGPTDAVVGETVTYQFAVTHDVVNSDGTSVTNVTVVDDVAGAASYLSGDTDVDDALDDGETWLYEVTYAIAADDVDPLLNTVAVNGTDALGDPAPEATDNHSTNIEFAPVLQVVKSGPASADYGDTITYSFAVAHDPTSDDSAVTNVVVTDDVAGAASLVSGDTNTNGALDGGETWTLEVTYAVGDATPDPLLNEVTVSGDDRDGDPITDATDTHSADIVHSPTLEVVKSGPAEAAAGSMVTYTFAVSHGADSDGSPIQNVTVVDDVAGAASYVSGDSDADNMLDSGETWQYSATYTIPVDTVDPLVNVVTVDGDDLGGVDVADVQDTHSTDVTFAPVLTVTKSGPATASVSETVTYTFSVSHDATSDGSAVSGVTVVDDVAGAATLIGGDDGDGLLEAGELWVYTATYTIDADEATPLVNTVSVNGIDRDDEALPTAQDNHSTDILFAPVLAATKTGPATAEVGDVITYTVSVFHDAASDGSPVSNVVVDDSLIGVLTLTSGDTDADDLLDSGETWVYEATYTVLATDPDPLTNTVDVDGTDKNAEATPTANASHDTDIEYLPVLTVDKTAVAEAAIGDAVVYTFTITHDATSDDSPVAVSSVSDDLAGPGTYVSGDTNTNGLLDAGENWVYTATRTVTQVDVEPVVNMVTVTYADGDSDVATATDSHSLGIDYQPVLQVVKSGVAVAAVGQEVTYDFEVSHAVSSDGSPVTGITVDDDVAGSATYVSGDDGDGELEGGETWLYQVTYTIQASDLDPLTNTVTVEGTDLDSTTVTATDDHIATIDFAQR